MLVLPLQLLPLLLLPLLLLPLQLLPLQLLPLLLLPLLVCILLPCCPCIFTAIHVLPPLAHTGVSRPTCPWTRGACPLTHGSSGCEDERRAEAPSTRPFKWEERAMVCRPTLRGRLRTAPQRSLEGMHVRHSCVDCLPRGGVPACRAVVASLHAVSWCYMGLRYFETCFYDLLMLLRSHGEEHRPGLASVSLSTGLVSVSRCTGLASVVSLPGI